MRPHRSHLPRAGPGQDSGEDGGFFGDHAAPAATRGGAAHEVRRVGEPSEDCREGVVRVRLPGCFLLPLMAAPPPPKPSAARDVRRRHVVYNRTV